MQTGERQASVNPDYEKRSWLTLGLFACFKTSKMESSITATPPSCQGKGEKGINSVRYVCLVIPICISLFCERFSKFVITIFCYAQGPIIAWLYKLPMKKSCTGSFCPSCLSLLSLSPFFFCNYPSLSNIQGSPRANFWCGRVCVILMKHVTYVVRILYQDITTLGLCHL